MRVLIVHNRYQQAGGEDMVVALEAQMLRAAGHEVTLAEANNDGISGFAAKARTLLRTPYDSTRRGWIAEAVKAANAEVVHIHNFFPRLTPAVHDGAAATGAAGATGREKCLKTGLLASSRHRTARRAGRGTAG